MDTEERLEKLLWEEQVKKVEVHNQKVLHGIIDGATAQKFKEMCAIHDDLIKTNARHEEMLQVMMEKVEQLVDKHTKEMSAVCEERDQYKQEVDKITNRTKDEKRLE